MVRPLVRASQSQFVTSRTMGGAGGSGSLARLFRLM